MIEKILKRGKNAEETTTDLGRCDKVLHLEV